MKAIHKLLNHPKINGNQSEASRLTGASQQRISYWAKEDSKSDIPVSLLRPIAKALGVKPDYLIP